jgi:hypothetical protein
MWGLWFFPLVALSFLIGAAVGLVWLFSRRKKRISSVAGAVALPFGCAAMPVAGLALLGAIGSALQKSDTQLYEEIFGYRPTITDDRMLFDDFGSGRGREIFMRAEPTDTERAKLLKIPGLVDSNYTFDQFVSRGTQHGFTWWMSPESCETARIFDAPGFRGWLDFRVAECLNADTEFWEPSYIYVVASGRMAD